MILSSFDQISGLRYTRSYQIVVAITSSSISWFPHRVGGGLGHWICLVISTHLRIALCGVLSHYWQLPMNKTCHGIHGRWFLKQLLFMDTRCWVVAVGWSFVGCTLTSSSVSFNLVRSKKPWQRDSTTHMGLDWCTGDMCTMLGHLSTGTSYNRMVFFCGGRCARNVIAFHTLLDLGPSCQS